MIAAHRARISGARSVFVESAEVPNECGSIELVIERCDAEGPVEMFSTLAICAGRPKSSYHGYM